VTAVIVPPLHFYEAYVLHTLVRFHHFLSLLVHALIGDYPNEIYSVGKFLLTQIAVISGLIQIAAIGTIDSGIHENSLRLGFRVRQRPTKIR
jgi:hypothetical protein